MPMAKFGDECIFFAHVPKTGGTSVEQYLQDRFADVVLFDRRKSKGSRRPA